MLRHVVFAVASFILAAPQAHAAVVGHLQDIENIDFVRDVAYNPASPAFYAVTIDSANGNALRAFEYDETSGLAALIASYTVEDLAPGLDGADFSPHEVVVSPNGAQVYVSGFFGDPQSDELPFSASIMRFDVLNNGELLYRDRIAVASSEAIAISDTGRLLAVSGNGDVAIVEVATDGALRLVEDVEIGQGFFGRTNLLNLSFNNDATQLYASSATTDARLMIIDIDADDNTLSLLQAYVSEESTSSSVNSDSELVIDGFPAGVAVFSPDGQFLYSNGGSESNEISVYSVDDNGLLTYSQSVFNEDPPFSISADALFTANGTFYYRTDSITDNLSVWKHDPTTGGLSPLGALEFSGSTFPGLDQSQTVATSPGDNFLVSAGPRGISIFDTRVDLDVVKQVASSTGNTLEYNISITNNGPSDATNIVVEDPLPAELAFGDVVVNESNAACSLSVNVVSCVFEFLADTSTESMTVIAEIVDESSPSIVNTASAEADQNERDTTNNSDSVTTSSATETDTSDPESIDDGVGSGSSGGGGLPSVLLLLAVMITRISRSLIPLRAVSRFLTRYLSKSSSNGNRDSNSMPSSLISTCCSSLTPSRPPASPM